MADRRPAKPTGVAPTKRAGIAIDTWKLSIFERHLTQAGYAVSSKPGLTADTRMLYVVTENLEALAGVVKAANAEAARSKGG